MAVYRGFVSNVPNGGIVCFRWSISCCRKNVVRCFRIREPCKLRNNSHFFREKVYHLGGNIRNDDVDIIVYNVITFPHQSDTIFRFFMFLGLRFLLIEFTADGQRGQTKRQRIQFNTRNLS